MKIIFPLILVFTLTFYTTLLFSQIAYKQIENNKKSIVTKKDINQSQYNLSPFSNLQIAPQVSTNDLILQEISELYALGKFFKFHRELNENNYLIEIMKDAVKIKFFANKPELIEHKRMDDASKYSMIEYEIKRIDSYVNLEMKNLGNSVDEKGYLKYISEYSNNFFHPTTSINFIWKSNILIDKEIVNLSLLGSGLPDYGKILNRNVSSSHLTAPNGGPSFLFGETSDAIVLPHFAQSWNGYVWTTDESWNRITIYDKYFQTQIDTIGEYGNNSWQFKSPTGIDFGMYSVSYNEGWTYKHYPIYVADNMSGRIVRFYYTTGYTSSPTLSWYGSRPENWSVLKYNCDHPFDIATHKGLNTNDVSDDVIWYSEGLGKDKRLNCINANNGQDIYNQSINSINFNGSDEPIDPKRLSIYRSPDGQRNILAFVDKKHNALVFLKLNPNGTYSGNILSILPFGSQTLESVVLTSNNNGIDGTTVWAVSNSPGGCGPICGSMHTFKINYLNNSPVNVDYLASYWTAVNSDNSFVNLKNLNSQNGFLDIFTMEKWSDNFGFRRFKPGIDTILCTASNYCKDLENSNITVRTTNPSKIAFDNAEYSTDGINWIVKPNMIISGLIQSGQEYYLPSGTTNLKAGIPGIPSPFSDMIGTGRIKIKFSISPQDEDPYAGNNRIFKTCIINVSLCNQVGGGCPFVFVNNGSDFIKDNNILHRSEFEQNIGIDIEDKYILRLTPTFNQSDSTCQLQIKELNNDLSYFDRFKLVAIDHPVGTNLGITENNDFTLFFPQITSSSEHAEHNGNIVTEVLNYDSNFSKTVKGGDGDEITANFDSGNFRLLKNKLKEVLVNSIDRLNTVINKREKSTKSKFKISEDPHDFQMEDSVAIIIDPSQWDIINWGPPQKKPAGTIEVIDQETPENSVEREFAKRQNTSPVIITVGKNINIDSVVSVWSSNFMISYLAVTPVYYGGYIENNLQLIEANDSLNGDALINLIDLDQNYSILDSTTNLTLKFKNTIENVEPGFVRDYILITNGRYENVTLSNRQLISSEENKNLEIPHEYILYQNFPNPFNPKTTIKFETPRDGIVKFKIYNLTGKEVFSYEKFLLSGYHQLSFDGSNLASGIYFYKFVTKDFEQTKRMVLLK